MTPNTTHPRRVAPGTGPSTGPGTSAGTGPSTGRGTSVGTGRATRRAVLALATLGTAALAACASAPEPPAPTTVALQLAAGADSNGGAPVQTKVYYLTSTGTFMNADFFAVFQDPQATLGADLVGVDAYPLTPGASVADAKVFEGQQPSAIGVIAAFRDISGPGWRAVKPLAPRAENTATVGVVGSQVTIQ
ncbi:MAG: type VI secretion system lipoprotein TssJ [Pseudomonadota bacterium]